MGEVKACLPTVFCLDWIDDIKEFLRKGNITNSDLEMSGLLLLWLVMEEVCLKLRAAYVVFFNDNSPTIGWVKGLADRGYLLEMQIVRSSTLQLKKAGASPLTPLHIAGGKSYVTVISSRSFVSNLSWFCKNDTDLLNFLMKFPFFQIRPLGPSSELSTQ